MQNCLTVQSGTIIPQSPLFALRYRCSPIDQRASFYHHGGKQQPLERKPQSPRLCSVCRGVSGAFNLAELHMSEGEMYQAMELLRQLMERASKWYLRGALQKDPTSMHNLVGCYLQLPQEMALAMYWMGKLADTGDSEAESKLQSCEQLFKTRCAVCRQTKSDLMQCSQCRAYYYCSWDCQVSHWKTHKKECKQVKILKAGGDDVHEKLGLKWCQLLLSLMMGNPRRSFGT